MKILVVTDYISKDNKGGAWEFAYKFSKYASELVDVTIVCYKPAGKEDLPEFEEDGKLNIYRFREGKIVIPEIKKIDHDIAFVHSVKSFAVYRLSIGVKKKPIISMIQGTSYLERLINAGRRDLKYYALRFFEVYRVFASDALLFASKYMMMNSVRNFRAFKKSVYIPLAVEPPCKKIKLPLQEKEIEKMVMLDIKKGNKVICCIRRIVARTGVLNLVEAMSLLKDENVKLYIGGTGPYLEELKAKVSEYGLSDRVYVLGLISDEAKNFLYSKSYLSVVPTERLEGFCLSMVESMSYGCPSVVTPVGGMYEFMKDNGLEDLVSIDISAEGIASVILTFVKDKKLRDRYAKICKEVALKHNYRDIVKRFLKEISYVMERKEYNRFL
jgi:glycosyltransferase involved in cell wall biosynthesis